MNDIATRIAEKIAEAGYFRFDNLNGEHRVPAAIKTHGSEDYLY